MKKTSGGLQHPSSRAIRAVLREADIPKSYKLLIVAIADRLNRDGYCWPSLPRLARDAGMSKATVCRILPALRDADVIRTEPIIPPKSRTGHAVNSYSIDVSKLSGLKIASKYRRSRTVSVPDDETSIGLILIPRSVSFCDVNRSHFETRRHPGKASMEGGQCPPPDERANTEEGSMPERKRPEALTPPRLPPRPVIEYAPPTPRRGRDYAVLGPREVAAAMAGLGTVTWDWRKDKDSL